MTALLRGTVSPVAFLFFGSTGSPETIGWSGATAGAGELTLVVVSVVALSTNRLPGAAWLAVCGNTVSVAATGTGAPLGAAVSGEGS
jgi:hypothetical protein